MVFDKKIKQTFDTERVSMSEAVITHGGGGWGIGEAGSIFGLMGWAA